MRKISVSGLGYVGLTIAAAFGQIQEVVGYDKSEERINDLKKGYDKNNEIPPELLTNTRIHYTTHPTDLSKADFHIVSVPTPINSCHQPDLSMLLEATEMIGKNLKKGDIVVYESTLYPGATEEECIPLLEQTSKLKCGKDFGVGYSPERINPADKNHQFTNIIKIISAADEVTLNIMSEVYSQVVTAGVHRVSNMRIAEAAKVVENTQRDLNISFINEIALILHSIGMDSFEVIEAARTKWNFLPFKPGLVGGHCIGVNSYFLTYKAEESGYHPDVIQAGRRVNDYMPKFIAEQTIKKLIQRGVPIKKARIGILGVTYKENCPDLHDSLILNLISELQAYEAQIMIHDPLADPVIAKNEFGILLREWDALSDCDAIILAVAHQFYMSLEKKQLQQILRSPGLIMDIKNILTPSDFSDTNITVWRL